ncbi:MAG TPA: class I SAM-dependent methyltransferase [Candidatus Dormibacteraeota bacterium]|nr:class I SAM-dependent methyltransferase [Candidatus Dormibacteraeota bacterium]
MRYRPFLSGLHERIEPPTYLEVGVRKGGSLALARSPAIGIDPDIELNIELGPETTLFEETSDEYFARPNPLEPIGGRPVGMAFIDGMHLVEYALRDFINIERHSEWTTVVVFDDILPRNETEALRDRQTTAWTGDIFKILGILERHRPDLICLRIGTKPTGLLVVLGLDPTSDVLGERYTDVVAKAISPDPQKIPDEVRDHRWVLDAKAVLDSSIWPMLRDARERGVPREEGIGALRRRVRRDLGRVGPGPVRRFLRNLRG